MIQATGVMLWLLSLLIPHLSYAEFRDPTKPNYPPPTVISPDDSTQFNEKFDLSAIWITATSKWAIINSEIVKEGQTLSNNVKVIKITRNTVSLRYTHGNIKILQLLPSVSKRQ